MNGDNIGGPSDDRLGVRSYMSDAEARSFHGLFMLSFIAFTVIAIIAHFLVYSWRPWLPPINGYANQRPAAATSMNTTTPASTQHS